jgi:cell division protein FtsB
MLLMGRLQDQSKVLMGEYQSLSDLKTQIIDEQEKEIETLQQENAKLKAGLPIIK